MHDDNSSEPISSANGLRQLLSQAQLGQREAARLLDVDERAMRQWCSGKTMPPVTVRRSLSLKLTHTEAMQRTIDGNSAIIAAIDAGNLTGAGRGSGASEPDSAALMRAQYVKKNEELKALLRLDAAFDWRQRALVAMNADSLPSGNGILDDAKIAEVDAADAEFKAAQAEVDRITREIRAGLR